MAIFTLSNFRGKHVVTNKKIKITKKTKIHILTVIGMFCLQPTKLKSTTKNTKLKKYISTVEI